MKKYFVMPFFVSFLIVISACTSSDEQDKAASPTSTPAVTGTSDFDINERLELEAQYEQLRQLQSQISEVWENLKAGETAQCGIDYEILAPESILRESELESDLRIAAGELRDAVNLWLEECDNQRETVPPDVIDRGVLMVRAAGDALNAAEDILNGEQGDR